MNGTQHQYCVLREHIGNSFFYVHVGCQRSLVIYTRVPVGDILSLAGSSGLPLVSCAACGEPLIEIPQEDRLAHTDARPFCGDPTCGCSHDPAYKWEFVGKPLLDGLITENEAVLILSGQQV